MSTSNIYMFGTFEEMMVEVATHAQTSTKMVTPSVDESRDIGCTRHKGL